MRTIEEYFTSGEVDNRGTDELYEGNVVKIDGTVYVRDDGDMRNHAGNTFIFKLRNVVTNETTIVDVPSGTGIKPSDIMDNMNADELEYIVSRRYSGMKFERDMSRRTLKVGSRLKLDDDDEYMVSMVDYETIGLVSLADGCRWSTNVKVHSTISITCNEINLLVGMNYVNRFTVSKVRT